MAVYRGHKDEHGEKLIEFVGATIAKRERNGYDDSDFLALVETQEGEYKWIEYATTRFATYDMYATIDATEEVKTRYTAYEKDRQARAKAAHADVEAHMPRKGLFAIVTAKGKHAGKSGVITWVGPNKFDRTHRYMAHYEGLRKGMGIYDIGLDCRTSALSARIQPEEGEGFFITCDKIDVIAELDVA